jgi:hypothetical protein
MRATTLQVHAEVDRATPADKGQARYNWIVSRGGPDFNFTPVSFYPKYSIALGQGAGETAALSAARANANVAVGGVPDSTNGLVYHVVSSFSRQNQ